jgi:formylglycine-generating enzyme required for sulfatase activity
MSQDDELTIATPSAQRPVLPDEPLLAARYEDLGRLGAGGYGEVRRVRDRALDRIVAMKIVPAGSSLQPDLVEREARLMARLQHPGIVPVHDLGVLADGRIWFTMREVRGATLSERIGSWGLRRLVAALEAVASVVAYAHSEGVVHCDLKPSNVMIGPFGEVQLLDWGISRALSAAQQGPLQGTPAYLAPEVALGEPAGMPSDLYALGAILYRILTGQRPYAASDARGVLAAIRAGPPPPPESRVEGALPAELVELCGRAMAREPSLRPAAEAFAEGLRSWLDGARDRARAAALAEGADVELHEARALRTRAARLRAEADERLAQVAPHEPVERKRPAWERQDEADGLERQAELCEVRFVEAQRAALELASDLREAHQRLASYYRDRLADAERAGRLAEAVRYEVLLRAHDRGEHAAWLAGEAELQLETEPSGASVVAERYELRDRRWVPGEARPLGLTPLQVRLPRGSWRLRLGAPGRAEVLYPVLLERAGRWDRLPPGAESPLPVFLPEAPALGPEDCYVPAGWFPCGGDPEAPDALPARRIWVDGFVLRRFPVTHAEYRAFLQDQLDQGRDLQPLLPRHEADLLPVYRVSDGRVELGAFEGRPLGPDEPVVLVDHASAVAYCDWLARFDGLPWRLPHDLEWEKAARGTDGRAFPWGPHLDPTWTRMQRSTPEAPGPAPVHAHPEDESPYGVRGLGGNVRDWCGNGYRRHGPEGERVVLESPGPDEALRCVRGGSWHSGALFCRAAGRLVGGPHERRNVFGFRPCRSVGA